MSLGGPSRVHIAPQGYEDERIYQPAIENSADEVILVIHDEISELSDKCTNKIKEELQSSGILVSEEHCDFFDLEDSLTKISTLTRDNSGNSVMINISTGSKITAIAGMLASMMLEASPYYVKVEDYGEEPISKNVSRSFVLPAYPIKLEDEQFILVLQFIKETEDEGDFVAIKDLNEFVQREELPVVDGSKRSDENIYDIVNPKIIDPLAARDYIRIERRANRKILRLTDKGKNALKLSRYALGP